jgi:hypothetical protein
VRQLLVVDPSLRLPASAVLAHPWVAGGASAAPLPSVAAKLKEFNARRKFRDGVRKVIATNVREGGGGGGVCTVPTLLAWRSTDLAVCSCI